MLGLLCGLLRCLGARYRLVVWMKGQTMGFDRSFGNFSGWDYGSTTFQELKPPKYTSF